jgi:molybdopterin molybdotransferase
MISLLEACALLDAEVQPLPGEKVALELARGRYLVQSVTSDVDVPPHRKSLVDGYAVCSADFGSGEVKLNVVDEVVAGALPSVPVVSGQATRIMTGAAIPDGADAVVMVEQTEALQNNQVFVHARAVQPAQNVMEQAAVMQAGQVVVSSGCRVDAATLGLLAEVGQSVVEVSPVPKAAVITTGNELVPPTDKPGPGQIRNSNGPMLAAAVAECGAELLNHRHVRDQADELSQAITAGLQGDVLILSGGVSAGILDLVPGELKRQGVRQVFHRVSLKPGKPMWFGVLQQDHHRCLVFGLPGNPVSSLVCFYLFVNRALKSLMGAPVPGFERLPLASSFDHRGDRPSWWPGKLVTEPNGLTSVQPLPWNGSSDLLSIAKADGWIGFPAGTQTFEAATVLDFLRRPH